MFRPDLSVILVCLLVGSCVASRFRRAEMPLPAVVPPMYAQGSVENILDYGAVANTSNYDLASATVNGKALYDAATAKNNSQVLIPAGYQFTYIPHRSIENLFNVTIIFDGILSFYEGNISDWPMEVRRPNRPMNGIEIRDSQFVTLTSNTRVGAILGNGLHWWWSNIFHGTKRPRMISMSGNQYTLVEHLHLFNSPAFHIAFFDNAHALFQYVTIEVDVDGQRKLLQSAGHWDFHWNIPTFPLNTDGIDIAGVNITIRNCHVENFDDAYCPKPSNKGSRFASCTNDILVEDSTITNGVGASIGSVSASHDVNCIANVTFRRISFDHPIKAIYVKPNPCSSVEKDGSGIINNITYEDIYADTPLWWSIYVGTQQQTQPGGGVNRGCSFFYPLPGTSCPTQGCVPVTNLYLKNVFMENALLSPGLLRCNETGPCTGWEWNNVTIQSRQDWPVGSNNFLCHAIQDPIFADVTPGCVNHTSSLGEGTDTTTSIVEDQVELTFAKVKP